MRVFIFLSADFEHVKYGDKYKVLLLNRKMLMPQKYMKWQGKIGLFGGKIDEGETPNAAITRELVEELGMVLIDEPEVIHEAEGLVVYHANIGQFNQGTMTNLAGRCTEGLLDVFDRVRLEATREDEFVFPILKSLALDLV